MLYVSYSLQGSMCASGTDGINMVRGVAFCLVFVHFMDIARPVRTVVMSAAVGCFSGLNKVGSEGAKLEILRKAQKESIRAKDMTGALPLSIWVDLMSL